MLEPIVESRGERGPVDLVPRVSEAIQAFSRRDGYDLMSIAIHGWSEAQHDPEIRALIARFYLAFRDRLADAARHWQRTGQAAPDADPQDVAQALMSQILGYVVQHSIVAGTGTAAIARGLDAIAGPGR